VGLQPTDLIRGAGRGPCRWQKRVCRDGPVRREAGSELCGVSFWRNGFRRRRAAALV
jgi:hypothetical protein